MRGLARRGLRAPDFQGGECRTSGSGRHLAGRPLNLKFRV